MSGAKSASAQLLDLERWLDRQSATGIALAAADVIALRDIVIAAKDTAIVTELELQRSEEISAVAHQRLSRMRAQSPEGFDAHQRYANTGTN